jgi:hypothetical protein
MERARGTPHKCRAAGRDFDVFGLFFSFRGRMGRQVSDRNVSRKSKGTDLLVSDRLSDRTFSDSARENTSAFDDLVEPESLSDKCVRVVSGR